MPGTCGPIAAGDIARLLQLCSNNLCVHFETWEDVIIQRRDPVFYCKLLFIGMQRHSCFRKT